jgi:hypothetical protein
MKDAPFLFYELLLVEGEDVHRALVETSVSLTAYNSYYCSIKSDTQWAVQMYFMRGWGAIYVCKYTGPSLYECSINIFLPYCLRKLPVYVMNFWRKEKGSDEAQNMSSYADTRLTARRFSIAPRRFLSFLLYIFLYIVHISFRSFSNEVAKNSELDSPWLSACNNTWRKAERIWIKSYILASSANIYGYITVLVKVWQ